MEERLLSAARLKTKVSQNLSCIFVEGDHVAIISVRVGVSPCIYPI